MDLYKKLGWPMIPVQGKKPLTTHGWKDGSLDEHILCEWQQQHPDAGLGIVTGEPSGLMVVDIDPRHGGDQSLSQLIVQHGPLPLTPKVNTGGGGEHYYFKHPGGQVKNRTNLLPGIDVRGDGGLVVAPPSLHPDTGMAYHWDEQAHPDHVKLADLPDWLWALMQNDESGASELDPCPPTEGVSEGQRHDFLVSLAGTMRSRGMSEGAIYSAIWIENTQKCVPPLDEREVRSIARSVAQYPPSAKRSTPPKGMVEQLTGYYPNLIDIVLDSKGKTAFLEKVDGKAVVRYSVIVDEKKFLPPPLNSLEWHLSKADEVLPSLDSDSDEQLYLDLIEYLQGISKLPSDDHYQFLALWVMHTFLWDKAQYTPILLFYAVAARGKTRTGKGLIYVCWRGVHVITLREAHLIRLASNMKATLFIDVTNLQKKMERESSEDILLSRFEKGIKVPRVTKPEAGAFQDTVYYDVFGPLLISSNEPINHILETRAVEINMPETDRQFDDDVIPDRGRTLRARLLAFRVRWLDRDLPAVKKPAKNRLGDILRPLLQVLVAIKGSTDWFVNFVKNLEQKRRNEASNTTEAVVVQAIVDSKSEVANNRLLLDVITAKVNQDKPEKYRFSGVTIGKIISRLGFEKYSNGKKRGIIWDETLLTRLCERYGLNMKE